MEKLDVLRCKLAGYWYCLRFDSVLNTIEEDGYILRSSYDTRDKLSTWLKFLRLGIKVTLKHALGNMERCPWPINPHVKYGPANQ